MSRDPFDGPGGWCMLALLVLCLPLEPLAWLFDTIFGPLPEETEL